MMETAGASAPGSDRPARKGWFDRRTFWPAVVIVLLVAAVVAIPTWLNHAVAESTSTVSQGETATLEADDEKVVVEPIPGWERVDSPPEKLQLRDGKATVSVNLATSVNDLGHYYQRQTRSLRADGKQALPGKPGTTDTGYAVLTGTLVSDGQAGELSVLAIGETSILTVQSLIPPDRVERFEPQITAMVNSVREK